jgi:hypothetical protein
MDQPRGHCRRRGLQFSVFMIAADLRFVRLLDASQAFTAVTAVVISAFGLKYLPTIWDSLIAACSAVGGIGAYLYIRRKKDNAYDELRRFGLTWLNQVLILGNVLLAVGAVALIVIHSHGATTCKKTTNCRVTRSRSASSTSLARLRAEPA